MSVIAVSDFEYCITVQICPSLLPKLIQFSIKLESLTGFNFEIQVIFPRSLLLKYHSKYYFELILLSGN